MSTEVGRPIKTVPENQMAENLLVVEEGSGVHQMDESEVEIAGNSRHTRTISDREASSADEDDCDHGEHENCTPEALCRHLNDLRMLRVKTPNIPTTVTVLSDSMQFNGEERLLGKVYLVGTAHFSVESQQDVRQTIRETQPDVVMLELCPSRVSILALDEETLLKEASSLTTEKIIKTVRESGVIQGVMHVLLLSMSAHITRQLGMAPGGEFRAAVQEAQKVPGCRGNFGDRPIQITMARALGTLSFWQQLRFFFSVIWSHNMTITKEDVEKCKQSDLLEEFLREMAGEFPELSRIFVQERDQYMARGLSTLLQKEANKRREIMPIIELWEPIVIVAVVGMGHVPGIVANWKRDVDIDSLLQTPKSSKLSHCIRTAVKIGVVGVAAHVIYKSAMYFMRLLRR